MLEWEDNDRYSFDDSDRFEEDSICSWISEPESVVNNWRGWKRLQQNQTINNQAAHRLLLSNHVAAINAVVAPTGAASSTRSSLEGQVLSLTELAAREVASSIPFELVEHYYPPVPEQLQLRIAFWSFPEQEEDIRLYSCLANGSAEEFNRGEHFYKLRAVKNPLQIGFHLSATVTPVSAGKQSTNSSVTFDRKNVISCQCSCNSQAEWCCHVVALCLHRIHNPASVMFRAPVSESLTRLQREQLQKFAQYLIAELPQQILPTAQRILDELLNQSPSSINDVQGAPDPTAGGALNDTSSWCLDRKNLKDNIKKILIKFCVPAPIVFSDVNYLSTATPPSASEWCSFLRPLRGREPEGMWNLLSIVREMFKRNDRNSVPLLEIITQQCLETAQIMVWWFNTKIALTGRGNGGGKQVNSNSQASQNACSSLCDELATLWKLAAINPCISPQERNTLKQRLIQYHLTVIEKIQANSAAQQQQAVNRGSGSSSSAAASGSNKSGKPSDLELFPGFKPAIEGCTLTWDDCPIPGVTYGHNSHYLSPFAVFKLDNNADASQINSSPAVLRCEYPRRPQEEESQEENPQKEEDESSSVDSGMSGKPDGAHAVVDPEPEKEKKDDEYQVYFYDPKEVASLSQAKEPPKTTPNNKLDVFRNLRQTVEDPWEVLFMRAEGIHAHGYHAHACQMAVQLAHEMLKNPPNLITDTPVLISKGKKKRVSAASHTITATASTTLAHCGFLCTVLSENPSHTHLAFRMGMFGLEMPRPPASTKPMEVKLAHQESELVNLLKRIALGPLELNSLREKAVLLREGKLRNRGEALLPLMLASYIFGSLIGNMADVGDEQLGFDAAVAALGLKANVSEADHPLLCEGTRRQRGDLALLLLSHYKDQPERLCKIMDKILDKEIHQLFKSPILPNYYVMSNAPPQPSNNVYVAPTPPSPPNHNRALFTNNSRGFSVNNGPENPRLDNMMARLNIEEQNQEPDGAVGGEMVHRPRPRGPGSDSGSSGNSTGDSFDSSSSSSRMQPNEHPRMAQALSQNIHPFHNMIPLPNSNLPPPNVPPASNLRLRTPQDVAMSANYPQHPSMMNEVGNMVRTSLPNMKVTRFKGKRVYPSLPNQPSEALAHFMFEMAKQVLNKAGGNSSTSLFTQPTANQNPRGPHRALHMCAFQLGLYALGLYNRVTPNWLSRTYSSHVSWITGQAMEIGASAISFLMGTWQGHLTPPEAASIADKASKNRDPPMVRAAAGLALSVLPQAAALNPNEIQRAIQQCKEQSYSMLERALNAVERASADGGVYPEVMFEVGRHWYYLFENHLPQQRNGQQQRPSAHQSEPPPDPRAGRPIQQHDGMVANQLAAAALAQLSGNFPPPGPPPQQVPMPYPAIYSLIPGIAAAAGNPNGAAGPVQLPMYAMSPQNAAAAALRLQGLALAASGGSAAGNQPPGHIFQPPGGSQRFGLTGSPLYQFGAAGFPLASLIPPPGAAGANPMNVAAIQQAAACAALFPHHPPPPPVQPHVNQQAFVAPGAPNQAQGASNSHQAPPGGSDAVGNITHTAQRYLIAAYSVGMLALEYLGRRLAEDRPQVKFTRNPSYGEDVKWLFSVSGKLGLVYVQNFMTTVLNRIVSPFLLQELAYECGKYLANISSHPPQFNPLTVPPSPGQQPAQHQQLVLQQIRTNPQLNQVVQKCYQTYYQCIHQRLYHVTPAEYEEFVNVLCHAKKAFHWTQEGVSAFQQLLASIKRSKNCKKELWQKITSCTHNNDLSGSSSSQTGGNSPPTTTTTVGGPGGAPAPPPPPPPANI